MSGNEKEFKITPWEVKGEVDYEKILKDFGVNKIDDSIRNKIFSLAKEKELKVPLALKRGFYYAHRDLDIVIKKYEKGENIFLYTGRGPSGKLHIGHIIQFQIVKFLQDLFDANLYIMFSDDEKFVQKKERSLKEIDKITNEQILQISALNFNTDKTFIFKNTEFIPKLYKDLLKIGKNISLNVAKQIFGFDDKSNIAFTFYPSIQIIPTFFEEGKPLIPAAIDQDPYFRLQRDLAVKFGREKAASIYSKFFMPLQGPNGKMSSSNPNSAIFLNDTSEVIEKKIKKYAFSGGRPTLEEHKKLGGIPEIDVSFQYLKLLFEENDEKIKDIENRYRKGELLTGELKKYTIEKAIEFISNFQKEVEKSKNEKRVEKYMYSGKLANKMWNLDKEIL